MLVVDEMIRLIVTSLRINLLICMGKVPNLSSSYLLELSFKGDWARSLLSFSSDGAIGMTKLKGVGVSNKWNDRKSFSQYVY